MDVKCLHDKKNLDLIVKFVRWEQTPYLEINWLPDGEIFRELQDNYVVAESFCAGKIVVKL